MGEIDSFVDCTIKCAGCKLVSCLEIKFKSFKIVKKGNMHSLNYEFNGISNNNLIVYIL